MRVATLAACALAATLGAARAQDACETFKWPVTRERQAFAGATPTLASGAAYPGLGTAVTVTLSAQAEVAYTVQPSRPPRAAPAHGAELAARVDKAGTYQVTVSSDAWIDLVQAGRTLRSAAFSGREGCAAVRKSVRFALRPGPVTIAISDAAVGSLMLDIVPAE